MDKREVAQTLEEIALLLDLDGANPFKVRAFETGARAVMTMPDDLEAVVRQGTLDQIKGIGKSLAGVIRELVTTGRARMHEELKARIPPGLLDLIQVPGLGPKKARVLYDKLQITTLGELEYACLENRLVELPGFGAKTQARIQAGIASVKKYAGFFRLGDLLPVAEELVARIRQAPGVLQAELTGDVRRHLEIAQDIRLLIATNSPAEVMTALASLLPASSFEPHGQTAAAARLPTGTMARLTLVPPAQFPFILLHDTGNDEHFAALQVLARGRHLRLEASGLFADGQPVSCRDEEEIYAQLGLAAIPPELRENTGEIEAARANQLPELISFEDIKGCFHVHSIYSDGSNTLPELVQAAQAKGWQYLGISDHSQTAYYAGGLKPPDLARQQAEVAHLNQQHPNFHLFWGIESDLLPNGSLDYPPEILQDFDFVIASVHSHFHQSQEDMTRRILTALANPYCTMLGHPTGRLLLARESYPVDLEAVLAAAQEYQVILELNASPYRLDLDWRWLKQAKERGLLISINPDAHNLEGLDDVAYGVMAARKGWLSAAEVLNTYSASEVARVLKRRRV